MDTPPPAPIVPDALAGALAPFGQSSTLPPEVYTSDAIFAWEQRWMFEASWVCVGRASQLSVPGAQRAVKIGDEGVVLLRDGAGDLRAFYNVCRHRGHELLEAGGSRTAHVVKCPYHAWVYGLDGSLKGAPRLSGWDGFSADDHGLVPARLVDWHGWLFVNADAQAPPFTSHVGDLEDLLAPYEPARLQGAARHDYVIEANWKIVTENYHECYHCPSIHPELCRVSPPDTGANFEPAGAWVGGSMELAEGAETMSLDGRSRGAVIPSLDAVQRRRVSYYGLFPNLLISPHPDYVMTHRMEPLAPGRTRVECEWLFPPEAWDLEGFDPCYAAEFWDLTNTQDWQACESVQRGVRSRGYRQGPLSPREDAVYQFITMIARTYLEGAVSRPAPPLRTGSPQA